MTQPNNILHEAKRLRLLAAALELQHFTGSAATWCRSRDVTR